MTSAKLAHMLRSVVAPEALYPIAATTFGLIRYAPNRGSLLVVHLAILSIAGLLDGEPQSPEEWLKAEVGPSATRDKLAANWAEWRHAPSLQ